MNIYVGNLASGITEDDLKQAFEKHGQVDTVKVIKDKYTGESKGFAFVEMPTKTEAQAAIDGLNGEKIKGSTLVVNEARPRTGGPGGGGGGNRRMSSSRRPW